MPEEAVKFDYASPVYGSLAYDYGSTAPELPYPGEREEARPRERVREEAERRAKEAEEPQTSYGVPVLGILGGILVAVFIVIMLLGYVELNRISAEKTKLRREIAELTEKSAKLKITYESTFNMSEVERYAINILGMTKVADRDANILQVNKTDRAEILSHDDTEDGILEKLSEVVASITAYFR